MGFNLKGPGGDRVHMAAITILGGAYLTIRLGVKDPVGIGALGLLICGIGLWFNKQWARFTAVALFLVGCVWGIFVLTTNGVSMLHVVFPILTLASAWWIWRDFSPKRVAEESDDKKTLVSLVLLLKEPRFMEDVILQEIVSSAWDEDYSGKDESNSRYVVGKSPLFMVHSGDEMYLVHNFDRPYFDNVEEVAKGVDDMRLANAVRQHQGWISVDLLGLENDDEVVKTAYLKVAKLIAELGGPDCLAILQPDTGRINAWDESMEARLKSDSAIEEFATPTNVPVWEVSNDDPRMKAASEEANRRWPEFVEAFRKKDGETFTVKVPITVGDHTEFIWVHVTGLEPEYIHGTLGNDPVALEGMKLGDVVEVAVKDLNDWGIVRNEELIGCFTTKALAEIHQERKAAAKKAQS